MQVEFRPNKTDLAHTFENCFGEYFNLTNIMQASHGQEHIQDWRIYWTSYFLKYFIKTSFKMTIFFCRWITTWGSIVKFSPEIRGHMSKLWKAFSCIFESVESYLAMLQNFILINYLDVSFFVMVECQQPETNALHKCHLPRQRPSPFGVGLSPRHMYRIAVVL